MTNVAPMALRLTKELLNEVKDGASLEATMKLEKRARHLLSSMSDSSRARAARGCGRVVVRAFTC